MPLRTMIGVAVLCLTVAAGFAHQASAATDPSVKSAPVAPAVPAMRLSLDEAVALFLRQNLDLLMAKYGIESDRKSTRLNSSHMSESRMPSSA